MRINEGRNVRQITQSEKAAWADAISSSRFAVPGVDEYFQRTNFVIDIVVGGIRAQYCVPSSAVSTSTFSKFVRAVTRVAGLSVDLNIPKLEYIIIPFKGKRYWPAEPGMSVDAQHINGAFTYRNGNEVYVFREEEYPKVMLHEAIHHSWLDPSALALHGTEQLFRNSFHISPTSVLLIGEGIVEAFATYFHSQFIAAETHVDFDSIWKRELQWMEKQASRVISRTHQVPWQETTNAFTYIVVRWLCCKEAKQLQELKHILVANSSLMPFFTQLLTSNAHVIARMRADNDTCRKIHDKTSMRLTVFGDI